MLDGDDGFRRSKLVQRTAAERAAIVAETYETGATVAGVAEQPLGFAGVAVMPEPVLSAHDGIKIVLGALVLRLPKSTPSKRVIGIARGVMAR